MKLWPRFILGWVMVGLLLMNSSTALAEAPAASAMLRVYIGTYTGAKSKGIYLSQFDPAKGELTSPELVAETKNPTFLAVHPNRHFLYAIGEVDSFAGKKSGGVSAFSIEPKTGKLLLLNQQPSGGTGPCHLTVDKTATCLLVANYGSGSIAALPIGADGKLGAATSVIQHKGSSVNAQRQEGPHSHFITADPGNRFALTCDLGLDKVLAYKLQLSATEPTLTANEPPAVSLKAGSGPRHLAFHPNGRFAFLINEMASTLTSFAYDGQKGALMELQTVSLLPENFKGNTTAAEVQMHPSGKFVYGSNRGNATIAVFGFM